MSSLLPSCRSQFQLEGYWEKFFRQRKAPFEWYGEYLDLCHVLHRYIKQQNRLLVVGCGNSKLSEQLYDVGFQSIDNIDISETVIRQMTARNSSKCPLMKYHRMDVLEMSFTDCTFDCVLDKGTLDALCSDSESETLTKVNTMFSEIRRVLKPGGRYVCVSLCQEHVMEQLLGTSEGGWITRGHVIKQVGGDGSGGVASTLPVFVFVMTKMVTVPNSAPVQIFEYVASEDDKCIRCNDSSEMIDFVKGHQQYTMVQHHLSSLHLDEQFSVDLWSKETASEPRFTLRVVDQPRRKAINGLFAIFLVPQGRETNWLFSSEDGCIQLAESAGYERLIIVTLHRGHTYSGLDQVKDEISSKAMELAQNGLPEGKKWPVLTLAEEMGSRTVLMEGTSPVSGQFVVEESQDEEQRGVIRRLVFLDSPHLAQTELLVTRDQQFVRKSKSRKHKATAGTGTGSSSQFKFDEITSYHKAMLGSLALIEGINWEKVGDERGTVNILLIGLGGGALSMFLKEYLPNVCQDVVELDPSIVQVSVDWFGFRPDSVTDLTTGIHVDGRRQQQGKVHVFTGDGVQFVTSLAAKQQGVPLYHAIVLDVDNKDITSGLNSPPLSFTTDQFLQSTKALLYDNGVFVSSLTARNKTVERSVFATICSYFSSVVMVAIPEYIHNVVVGLKTWRNDIAASTVKSCDGHVAADNVLKSVSLVLSKQLRSQFDSLSLSTKRTVLSKEFVEFFKDSSLWIHENSNHN